MEGGQATKILEGLSNYLNVAIADSGVFFVPARATAVGSSLQFLSFATNKIRPVANFEKPLGIAGLGTCRFLLMADGFCTRSSIKQAAS